MPRTNSVVCGDGYSVFLSDSGEVFSFGKANLKGHGHKKSLILSPTVISGLQNIVRVDCGYEHTVCLNKDGCLFFWS